MSRRKKKSAEPFDRARTEALWAKQVELDMSTAAFCASEGLDVRAYNRWKGRLIGLRIGRLSEEKPMSTPPPAEAPLVDVTARLTPPARAESGVEVILADGIRLRRARGRAREVRLPGCRESGVAIAELPPRPLHRGRYAVGFIAWVVVSKYAHHLPLYRLVYRQAAATPPRHLDARRCARARGAADRTHRRSHAAGDAGGSHHPHR